VAGVPGRSCRPCRRLVGRGVRGFRRAPRCRPRWPRRRVPTGAEQGLELEMGQPECWRLGRDPRPPDVLRGRVVEDAVDDACAVEAGHDREPSGDRRWLVAGDLLHPAQVQLDVRAFGVQRVQALVAAPGQLGPERSLPAARGVGMTTALRAAGRLCPSTPVGVRRHASIVAGEFALEFVGGGGSDRGPDPVRNWTPPKASLIAC
jgi:hypothetical protein